MFISFPYLRVYETIFNWLIPKSFQNEEERCLFHCDGTLGCRLIQDTYLCNLEDL